MQANSGNYGFSEFCRHSLSVKLLLLSEDKIYFGAFPSFGGPEDNVTADIIEDFNDAVGKDIVGAYFSNNWGIDGVRFPREKVDIIADTGTVPFVRMMLRTAFENEDKFCVALGSKSHGADV